jgi:hypothetical protein
MSAFFLKLQRALPILQVQEFVVIADIAQALLSHLARQPLAAIGYREALNSVCCGVRSIEPGTYALNVTAFLAVGREALLPVDVFIHPRSRAEGMPMLLQLESWHDHRDAAQRAHRAVKKYRLVQTTYGESFAFALMLTGHTDGGVLGTLAAESIDWVWEHRVDSTSLQHLLRVATAARNLMLQPARARCCARPGLPRAELPVPWDCR